MFSFSGIFGGTNTNSMSTSVHSDEKRTSGRYSYEEKTPSISAVPSPCEIYQSNQLVKKTTQGCKNTLERIKEQNEDLKRAYSKY